MIILQIYLAPMAVLACWMGWCMHRKLDHFDWHFYRSDIWVDFWVRLLFWPLILIFSPSSLVHPQYKFGHFWGNLAERARQRERFIKNPPPCGVMVSYKPGREEDGKEPAEFIFRAADVEAIAKKVIDESPNVEGIRGAVRWTSCRDETIQVPTHVPEILPNFGMIAEDLIVAGLGQVRCSECGKTYSASEISCESSGIYFVRSGWVYNFLICPSRHKLLSREVMHMLLRRQEE